MYRLWWHLGHLLGVSPEFYRRVRSQQDAADLLELLDATDPPATEQGAQLANAALGVVAGILTDTTRLEPRTARPWST